MASTVFSYTKNCTENIARDKIKVSDNTSQQQTSDNIMDNIPQWKQDFFYRKQKLSHNNKQQLIQIGNVSENGSQKIIECKNPKVLELSFDVPRNQYPECPAVENSTIQLNENMKENLNIKTPNPSDIRNLKSSGTYSTYANSININDSMPLVGEDLFNDSTNLPTHGGVIFSKSDNSISNINGNQPQDSLQSVLLSTFNDNTISVSNNSNDIKNYVLQFNDEDEHKTNTTSVNVGRLRKIPHAITDINSLKKLENTEKSNFTTKVANSKSLDEYDESTDNSILEDLQYGPGIVSKLRCRYLSLAMRNLADKHRQSLCNIRRTTSLNNLVDGTDDEICTKNNYLNFDETKVPDRIKENISITCSSVTNKNSLAGRFRNVERGTDSLKRARSVEALYRYDNNAWQRDVIKSTTQSQPIHENTYLDTTNSNDFRTNTIINGKFENKIYIDKEKVQKDCDYYTEVRKPKRIPSVFSDTERPPTDVVKHTLRIFETSLNRCHNNIPYSHNNAGVAAKIASFKTMISKPQFTNKKNKLNNKPVIIPRTFQNVNQYQPPSQILPNTKQYIPVNSTVEHTCHSSQVSINKNYQSIQRNQNVNLNACRVPTDIPSAGLTECNNIVNPNLSDNTTMQIVRAKRDDNYSNQTNSVEAQYVSNILSRKQNSIPILATSIKPKTSNVKKILEIKPTLVETSNKLDSQSYISANCDVSLQEYSDLKFIKVSDVSNISDGSSNDIKSLLPSRDFERAAIKSKYNNNITSESLLQENTDTASKLIEKFDEFNTESSLSETKQTNKKQWQPNLLGTVIDNNTMIFNFSDRKDIPDYIDKDSCMIRRDKEFPKPGDSGFVFLDNFVQNNIDGDELWTLGPPSPCDIEFENANIVIDGKSCIRQSPKDQKLKIQFHDKLISTFEYPSETSLILDESSVVDKVNQEYSLSLINMPIGSIPLGNYVPIKGAMNSDFELGVTPSKQLITESENDITSKESIAAETDTLNSFNNYSDAVNTTHENMHCLKPATEEQTVLWSVGTRETDLLF